MARQKAKDRNGAFSRIRDVDAEMLLEGTSIAENNLNQIDSPLGVGSHRLEFRIQLCLRRGPTRNKQPVTWAW